MKNRSSRLFLIVIFISFTLLDNITIAQGLTSSVELEVSRAHPGWKTIVGTDEFSLWLKKQPSSVQNLTRSSAAKDAILLLNLYGKVTNPNLDVPMDSIYNVGAPIKFINALGINKTSMLFEELSKSVVMIQSNYPGGSSQGSGVIIGDGVSDMWGPPNRVPLIVTNSHVVGFQREILVKYQGIFKKGTVIYQDPEIDLAFIYMEPTPLTNRVDMESPDAQRIGDSILTIGAPLGLENTLSTGVISSFRKKDGIDLVQITAPISPGSSGGPLFNINGDLIGINTFKFNGGENINFAVSGDYVFDIRAAIAASSDIYWLLNTDQSKMVKEASRNGDLVKWFWASEIDSNGKRKYQIVNELIRYRNKLIQENNWNKSTSGEIEKKVSTLVLTITKEVPKYKKASRKDITNEEFISCHVNSPNNREKYSDWLFKLNNNTNTAQMTENEVYSYKNVGPSIILWQEQGPNALQWRLNRNTKYIEGIVIQSTRGWRAGEVMFAGLCLAQ